MRSMRDYAVITASYWAFTITDGAMRMLVLLHLHALGYSSLKIATLFLFYETFGVITNLLGGWLGSRFGLKSTLTVGLTLQVGALGLLAQETWGLTLFVVLIAQAASGVAKDLTKMSAKSYIRLLIPDDNQSGLMKWVAILTGSKNALKGAGFFVGGFLLQRAGFSGACLNLMYLVLAAVVTSIIMLPKAAGKSSKKLRFRELLSHNSKLNWLALARFFLFGSRDAWFVLALPLFLASFLGWAEEEVGGFLAVWVIGYGIVQSMAPKLVGKSVDGAPGPGRLMLWTFLLVLPLLGTVAALEMGHRSGSALTIALLAFGLVFAVTSAIHSYLVVSYAENDNISATIGFYYMANALGRLIGTIISGAVYQAFHSSVDGLRACLLVSVSMVIAAGFSTAKLRRIA